MHNDERGVLSLFGPETGDELALPSTSVAVYRTATWYDDDER